MNEEEKRAVLERAYKYSQAFQELTKSSVWSDVVELLTYMENKYMERLVNKNREDCRYRIRAVRWLKELPEKINKQAQRLFASPFARGFNKQHLADSLEKDLT